MAAPTATRPTRMKTDRRRRPGRQRGLFALAALSAAQLVSSDMNAAAAAAAATPQQYIVNGVDPTSPARYPYLVSLGLSRSDHSCGATLIAPDILLSAAHCNGSIRWATLGMYDRDDHNEDHHGDGGRQYVRIDETVTHPFYRWTSGNPDIDYDFLIIKLSSPADATRFQPVRLNRNPSVPGYDNQRLTVAGWGATDADGLNLSDKLLDGTVGYVSPNTCNRADGIIEGTYYSYRGFLTNSMMCAWSEDVDACLGDSGGPLLLTSDDGDAAEDVQVGIVSFGVGCNSPDFPGLYSRISDQIGWIDEIVCSLSDDPPADFECGGGQRVKTPKPTRRPTRRPTPAPQPAPAKDPSKQSVLDFLLGGAGDEDRGGEEDGGGDEPKPTPRPTRKPGMAGPDKTSEPTTERTDWSETETGSPTDESGPGFVETMYATSGGTAASYLHGVKAVALTSIACGLAAGILI